MKREYKTIDQLVHNGENVDELETEFQAVKDFFELVMLGITDVNSAMMSEIKERVSKQRGLDLVLIKSSVVDYQGELVPDFFYEIQAYGEVAADIAQNLVQQVRVEYGQIQREGRDLYVHMANVVTSYIIQGLRHSSVIRLNDLDLNQNQVRFFVEREGVTYQAVVDLFSEYIGEELETIGIEFDDITPDKYFGNKEELVYKLSSGVSFIEPRGLINFGLGIANSEFADFLQGSKLIGIWGNNPIGLA
jgi:hypothetical protein